MQNLCAYLYKPCDLATSARSHRAAATADSITTTARIAMHASWRPLMTSRSGVPVSVFSVSCGDDMLEVGFTATRTTTGLPLVMPPTIPPEWS